MVGWEGSVIGAKGGIFGFERVGRFHVMHSSGRLHANMARRQGKRKVCLKERERGGARQIIDETPRRWG